MADIILLCLFVARLTFKLESSRALVSLLFYYVIVKF